MMTGPWRAFPPNVIHHDIPALFPGLYGKFHADSH